MIRQFIELNNYGWKVWVFYGVDTYYTEEILQRLAEIGCDADTLARAKANLDAGAINTGFTYSNYAERKSVMVIAITSSPEQFQNSYDHEKGHLCQHIVQAEQIDPFGEETQYLAGEIGQLMFPVAKYLLCGCCRNRVYEYVRKPIYRTFHQRSVYPRR